MQVKYVFIFGFDWGGKERENCNQVLLLTEVRPNEAASDVIMMPA
jgi:hypothetical protein